MSRETANLMAFKLPSVEYPEPPPPDPSVLLYGRILAALSSLQMALSSLTIPAPVVQVSEPDFEGLVQALMQSRPEMIDYDKIVTLVRDAIDLPAPVVNVDNSAVAQGNGELMKVLEGLAFSIKGIGRMGSGGGSVSLQPGQTLQGINSPVTVTGTVATTTPALPSTIDTPQVVVASTGTAVQFPSNALTVGAIVQAFSGNSASVWIGGSGVTHSNGSGQVGYELQPGQAASAAVSNTNILYVNGTSGDGVCVIGS